MLHSDAMPEKMAKTLPKPLTPEGQEAAEAIGVVTLIHGKVYTICMGSDKPYL